MEFNYIIEICVAIDIAIIGLAYPITLDKISNIGSKYKSNYLSRVFEHEFPQISLGPKLWLRSRPVTYFEWLLFAAFFSFLFLVFEFEPWFPFLADTNKLVVFLLTASLLISLIIWVDKVALYIGKPTRLLTRLISKYKSKKTDSVYKTYLLKTINEFTTFAVENEDEHLLETLSSFYTQEFLEMRDKHPSDKPIEYPIDFYLINRNIIKKQLRKSREELDVVTLNSISNWWLLGQDFKEIPISSETYSWMWGNITMISDSAKLIARHWGTAHQYYSMRLENIQGDYNVDTKVFNNQEAIDFRKKEKIEFFEFHIVLGGLLLYKDNNKGLQRILNYTTSQPAQYYLLPNSMYEVFYWFAYFKDGYIQDRTPVDFKYRFPEVDNLGISRQITFWICKYISLLFIRQYFVQINYTNSGSTDQPRMPDTVVELLRWKGTMDYFEFCLDKVLEEQELLNILGYTITDELRITFDSFKIELKQRIEDAIVARRFSAELSPQKIINFKTNSVKLISDAFDVYKPIQNSTDFTTTETDILRIGLQGTKRLMQKQAFTDGDIPHMNSDTIFGELVVSEELNRYIPNSLLTARTRRYLIERNDVGEALKQLKYKKATHIIVGVNFVSHSIQNSASYLADIINLPSRFFRDVLFVIPKSDLPIMKHNTLSQETIDFLQLGQPINEDKKIYASVIDLTQQENAEHRVQWEDDRHENPLESVQLTLAFAAELIWKVKRDVVQLNMVSPYQEQGIKDEIRNIEPFN
ncbi:hypothetical protein [Algibacter lectus]|uniref:Uncharacterized protein n=1 Tax=Algibacter lectus TaxID=221126 RepID=A0A4R8MAB0_9FLAO|nr:hypothetical protein [Algibacter lectus]MWW26027.1 hypothetical protein [Algibacter lectus]TDY60755.1 hypothetical protein DFQ06_3339 [Algibacter lectus]